MEKNPFRPTRYEHEQQPLLWYSPRAKQLEGQRSFYVMGPRGSGKTSLLRTLHWRERVENEVLRAQLKADRALEHISVYFRLPDHISFALGKIDWKSAVPNAPDPVAVSFSFFAALIESIASQLIFEALDDYRLRGLLTFTAAEALERIESFLWRYPQLEKFSRTPIQTYSQLSGALDVLTRTINVSATRGNVASILNALPVDEPGSLLQHAAELAVEQVREASGNNSFHIKVCIDDCEILRRDQQLSLNSIVRKAKSPLFWIISYVGQDFEATGGLYPNHNLTEADRKVVNLDDSREVDFIRFYEAVSSLRVYYSLTEEERNRYNDTKIDTIFSLHKVLGDYETNEIIDEIGKSALSQNFDSLRREAIALKSAVRRQAPNSAKGHLVRQLVFSSQRLPYYQAYLLRRLARPVDLATVGSQSQAELSRLRAYLRRKQRGALIAICGDLRVKRIPYAGRNVLAGISDGCIRDYLEIMGEIFEAFKATRDKLVRFLDRKTPISIKIQTSGMVRAAESKFAGIRENSESHAAELTRLVECLGQLTSLLHRDVRTAERGIFVIDIGGTGSRPRQESDLADIVARVVARGEVDGLIRSEAEDQSTINEETPVPHAIRFRLHRRFAPKFGFSHRGPYESARLPLAKVAEICLSPDRIDAREWAHQAYNELASLNPEQQRLFL